MVFLGLGSNLGDRAGNLFQALEGLQAAGCAVLRTSRLYETPPWGFEQQPAFLNLVAEVVPGPGPEALLELALAVEARMGRVRDIKWGPRRIDIDLLAYGNLQLDTSALRLPHPLLSERAFVLVPWAEIAPDFFVPGFNRTVGELLQDLARRDPESVRQALPLAPVPG